MKSVEVALNVAIWLVVTSWQEPKNFHFTLIGTARQSKQYKFRIYLIGKLLLCCGSYPVAKFVNCFKQRFSICCCVYFFFWQIVIHEAFFVCKLLFPKTFLWKLSFLNTCLLNVFWTNFENWPSGQHFTNNCSRSKLYKMEFTFYSHFQFF